VAGLAGYATENAPSADRQTVTATAPTVRADPPTATESQSTFGGDGRDTSMVEDDIDDVDQAILYALQEDARNMSSGDIAERTGTSDSTVRKRIQRLESREVIKGYSAEVDYGKSGYPLRMLLFCTASIPERGDLVSEILDIDGVVSVQELVTGEQNLLVTAVGESDSDITPVAQELLDMGLSIADEVLVRSQEMTPFGEFESDDEN